MIKKVSYKIINRENKTKIFIKLRNLTNNQTMYNGNSSYEYSTYVYSIILVTIFDIHRKIDTVTWDFIIITFSVKLKKWSSMIWLTLSLFFFLVDAFFLGDFLSDDLKDPRRGNFTIQDGGTVMLWWGPKSQIIILVFFLNIKIKQSAFQLLFC